MLAQDVRVSLQRRASLLCLCPHQPFVASPHRVLVCRRLPCWNVGSSCIYSANGVKLYGEGTEYYLLGEDTDSSSGGLLFT